MTEYYPIEWTRHAYFVFLPLDKHLNYLWPLAIIKHAVLSIHIQACLWPSVSDSLELRLNWNCCYMVTRLVCETAMLLSRVAAHQQCMSAFISLHTLPDFFFPLSSFVF